MRDEAQKQEVNEAAAKIDRYNISDALICLRAIEISFCETRNADSPPFPLCAAEFLYLENKLSLNFESNDTDRWI